jgi:hypothetical protein
VTLFLPFPTVLMPASASARAADWSSCYSGFADFVPIGRLVLALPGRVLELFFTSQIHSARFVFIKWAKERVHFSKVALQCKKKSSMFESDTRVVEFLILRNLRTRGKIFLI